MSRDIAIAPGTAANLDEVMAVMEAAFPAEYGEAWNRSQCATMLSMPHVGLLLARIEERTVGFAMTRGVAGEEELLLIATLPDHRGKGIGLALLNSVETIAKKKGVEILFLEVRKNNNAQSLYRKVGFEQIGIRRDYYRGSDGGRIDALTYSKKLYD